MRSDLYLWRNRKTKKGHLLDSLYAYRWSTQMLYPDPRERKTNGRRTRHCMDVIQAERLRNGMGCHVDPIGRNVYMV